MGFQTAIIGLQKDLSGSVTELLLELGLQALPMRPATGFEALGASYRGHAVTTLDGWTVISSPQCFITESPNHRADRLFCDPIHELVKRSRQMQVVGALVDGVTSTYGFARYQGGAVRRTRLEQEERVMIDEGEVSADEGRVRAEQPFGEDQAFGMLKAWGLPFDRLFDARFELYAPMGQSA